jgi:hypothetical protein
MNASAYIAAALTARPFVMVTRPKPRSAGYDQSAWEQLGGSFHCEHCGSKLTRQVVIDDSGKHWGRDCFATATGLVEARGRISKAERERIQRAVNQGPQGRRRSVLAWLAYVDEGFRPDAVSDLRAARVAAEMRYLRAAGEVGLADAVCQVFGVHAEYKRNTDRRRADRSRGFDISSDLRWAVQSDRLDAVDWERAMPPGFRSDAWRPLPAKRLA